MGKYVCVLFRERESLYNRRRAGKSGALPRRGTILNIHLELSRSSSMRFRCGLYLRARVHLLLSPRVRPPPRLLFRRLFFTVTPSCFVRRSFRLRRLAAARLSLAFADSVTHRLYFSASFISRLFFIRIPYLFFIRSRFVVHLLAFFFFRL